MNEIVRRISLDLSRKCNVRVLFASQYDFNSRVFLITLFNDGEEYPVPEGMLAVMNILRPDGQSAAYVCEVLPDGKIKYTAGRWALEIPGEARFAISLYDGEKSKLSSCSFIVDIALLPYAGDDITEESDEYSLFETMMDTLTVFNNAEVRRITAESERAEAEKERVRSEEEREANELIRIENESLRDQVEEKILSALDGLISVQNKLINDGVYMSTATAYPVGSVYISVNSTSPASLFGGVWERLKDRFLLGAGDVYTAGKTGGSANTVLLQHSHTINSEQGNPIYLKAGSDSSGWVLNGITPEYVTNGADSSWKVYAGTQGTAANGEGRNMPPYLTVYMWKRIG